MINPKILDLSSYQNVQDWDKVKAQGFVGIINKVTEGVTFKDWTFAVRYKPVTQRGMLFGAYHFFRPDPIPDQVDWFLSNIKKASVDPTQILLVLDHEDEHCSLDDAKSFLKLVRDKTGQRPVLYSGGLLKGQLAEAKITHDETLSEYRLWLAQYNSTCTWPTGIWPEYFLWQFTGDGVGPQPHIIDGIISSGGGKSDIDVSSFTGSDDDLRSSWIARDGVSQIVPMQPPVLPQPIPQPIPQPQPQPIPASPPPNIPVLPKPAPKPVTVVDKITDWFKKFRW